MSQEPNTVKSRLEALTSVVLDNSNFNRAFLPAIKTLLSKMLTNASEEDIEKGIVELRDKYIPWVLNGEKPGPVSKDFETLAQEHYWDTLEPHKDMILLHIKGILSIEAQHEDTPHE